MSECDNEFSTMRRPWPTGAVVPYVTSVFLYATLRAGTGLPVCERRKCKEKVKFAIEGPEG